MRPAIVTRYHGPTSTRGSRISASLASGTRLYREYDDALSSFENHRAAACAMRSKLHAADVKLSAGWTDNGYVFTFVYDLL